MLYNPIVMFLTGAALGALSKLLDVHTQNLGNIFSQLAIWILLGVVIVLFSDTRGLACLDIFVFCVGMLIAYYITAEWTSSVWSPAFVYGWALFSLFSPLFAYLTFMTKKRNVTGIILSCGIVLAAFMSSVILFHGPRVYDFIICLALIYLLFFHKFKPEKRRRTESHTKNRT